MRARIAALLVAATLAGAACANPEAAEPRGVMAELRAKYPAAFALIAGAEAPSATHTPAGFVVRAATPPRLTPASSRPWVRIDPSLTLTVERSGRAELRVRSGARIGIERPGSAVDAGAAAPPPNDRVSVERGAVVVHDRGAVNVVYAARPRGVEQLFVVREPVACLDQRLALPEGWSLRRAPGSAGLVEVLDERHHPRVRVEARVAWDATGRELAVEPSVVDGAIRFAVERPSAWPVVVDPEWQDVGSPATRGRATTTLLSNGKVLIAGGEESFGGKVLASAELFDPALAAFEATFAMNAARVNHVAAPLPNGKVLLAGGFGADGQPLATAELFDPATGGFEPAAGPMATARARASATVLPDGRVLVAGGALEKAQGTTPSSMCADAKNASETDAAELFNPDTGTFSTAGVMTTPRADHSATPLPDGRVLLAGGQANAAAEASAEIFEAGVGFTPAGPLARARRGHAAILLANGRVLVVGGLAADDVPTETAELFDPASSQFTLLPTGLGAARAYPAAAALADGTVVVAGGENAECFGVSDVDRFEPDATGGAFAAEPLPAIPSETYRPSLTLLSNGRVLLTGRNDAAVLYDATTLLGDASGTLSIARTGHTATLLPSGDVLVAGGDANDLAFASAEIFRLAQRVFEPSTSALGAPRTHATATRLVDGRVLFVGGAPDSSGAVLSSAETYDPPRDVFQPIAAGLADGRALHTATLLPDGRVLIVGGLKQGALTSLATAETFDPKTDTFTPAAGSMSSKRYGHTATLLVTGKVLIAGGANGLLSAGLASAELFDPATGTFTPAGNMGAGRLTHVATPLADGRVLVAGGTGETGKAELYNPIAGTFSFTSVTHKRFRFTATALPSQKVLLASGRTESKLVPPPPSFELFNPITGASSAAPEQALAVGSLDHTATLLPTGAVLVVGGFTYDPAAPPDSDLEYPVLDRWEVLAEPTASAVLAPLVEASRPILADVAPKAEPGTPVAVAGTGMRPFAQGSGGVHASPTNFPSALWMPLDGAPEVGRLAPWTGTSATWMPPAAASPGPGLLFLAVNGLRSVGLPVTLAPAADGLACSHASSCASGVCANGVCCDAPCGGCRACTKAKKGWGPDGTCEPVSAGLDPNGMCVELSSLPECGGSVPTCDGAGECASCVIATHCSNDTTLALPAGDSTSCAPFRCSDELKACLTTCASKNDCAPGLSCTADGRCRPPLDDQPPDVSCRAAQGALAHGTQPWGLALALVALGALARRRGAPPAAPRAPREGQSARGTGRRARDSRGQR